ERAAECTRLGLAVLLAIVSAGLGYGGSSTAPLLDDVRQFVAEHLDPPGLRQPEHGAIEEDVAAPCEGQRAHPARLRAHMQAHRREVRLKEAFGASSHARRKRERDSRYHAAFPSSRPAARGGRGASPRRI